MPEAQVSILGGLPVIAVVTFTRGDGWEIDDSANVDHLHWIKSDGTKGKEVSEKIYAKLDKCVPWWECNVIEQVIESLAYEDWVSKNGADGTTAIQLL